MEKLLLSTTDGNKIRLLSFQQENTHRDKSKIILGGASADASADLSADILENRFIKLKILLKHSRML